MIPFRLPTFEELQPWLEKLESHPSGCILIGITFNPDRQNYCTVGTCFLSEQERRKLKTALQGINRTRRDKGQPETNQRPILPSEPKKARSGQI